ncbi:MAG: protein-disulfide reductase DsbD family protein, partial [Ignavibacteriaceae bacterium]|nr:protein-disulfide reductase DsbD family protein [Ignavibacteriaceae bacterium]
MNRKIVNLFLIIASIFFTANTFIWAQNDVVKIKSYNSYDKIHAGSEFKLAVNVNVSEGRHINSDKPHEGFLIPTKLTIEQNKNFTLKKIIYPKAEDIRLDISDKPLSVWTGNVYFGGVIEAAKTLAPGKYKVTVNVEYQSCNNKTCLPPNNAKETIEVEVSAGTEAVANANQDVFRNIDFGDSKPQPAQAEVGNPASTGSSSLQQMLEHSGLLLSLILVFIGGLALNLT